MNILGGWIFREYLLNDVHCSLQIYTPYLQDVYKEIKCRGTKGMRQKEFMYLY